MEAKRTGRADRAFLERVFHKLLLNFTWWVNRKDTEGKNIFQGGFLGLDNIGVFNRSEPLPGGEFIEQADGTGWMATYSLNLLAIALELARGDDAYEDVASKFWEHFLYIASAISHIRGDGGMWNAEDGFFYDVLRLPGGGSVPLKVRSAVGLIPLLAVETLDPDIMSQLPGFTRRMQWFIENRRDLTGSVASMTVKGQGERQLLSIVTPDQLRIILKRMLDESEFLSPFGIRSLSRIHRDHPFVLATEGTTYSIDYEPAESTSPLFGGNSNWRGPVWFPLNYLLIESLQKFHHYLGCGRSPPSCHAASPASSSVMKQAAAPSTAQTLAIRRTRIGATWFCSTSTLTPKPALVWAPVIKPAGPAWSPSCYNKAGSSAAAPHNCTNHSLTVAAPMGVLSCTIGSGRPSSPALLWTLPAGTTAGSQDRPPWNPCLTY
jgi:hypothetical protein